MTQRQVVDTPQVVPAGGLDAPNTPAIDLGVEPAAPDEAPADPPSALRFDCLRNRIVQVAIIVLAVLWVYSPSYHGDWLWDDDQLLTNNLTVQHRVSPDPAVPTNSIATLIKLWFNPDGADYFPLSYTMLWAQWPFFGADSTGYHITNILLHLASSLLLWVLLVKMRIRGAWLTGLVFAVHPVCVESVAWVAEIKNTLSMPIFLACCCCWVDQDKETDPVRRQRLYALAILWFLAAMFAKTAVVAFPVLVLLHAWWRRGRVTVRDILLSLPFFLISLVLGLITISYQWGRAIGSEKVALDGLFTVGGLLSRVAISGTAVIHYLASIVWPVHLLPIHPRWEVDPPGVWMLLPWPLLGAAAWWMWRNRDAAFPARWGRHALFAAGFFLLMLAPVIGFVNISYMRITWVADHFIYTPMIGILAFICAGVVLLFERIPERMKPRVLLCGSLVPAVLAFLAFRYTMVWRNETELWEYTLKHNFDAWQAHNRLGARKCAAGDLDGAHFHFQNSVRLRPDLGETHNNLGSTFLSRSQIFQQAGDLASAERERAAAIWHTAEACRLTPSTPMFHVNLANALSMVGRFAESAAKYEEILGRDPNNPAMINNYGIALYKQGKLEESIVQFQRALAIAPALKDARDSLAIALADRAGTPKPPQPSAGDAAAPPPDPTAPSSPSGTTGPAGLK